MKWSDVNENESKHTEMNIKVLRRIPFKVRAILAKIIY